MIVVNLLFLVCFLLQVYGLPDGSSGIVRKPRIDAKQRGKSHTRDISTSFHRGNIEFISNAEDFIFFDDDTLVSDVVCSGNEITFDLMDTREAFDDFLGKLPVNVLLSPKFTSCNIDRNGEKVLSYYKITGIRKGPTKKANSDSVVATGIGLDMKKDINLKLHLETRPIEVPSNGTHLSRRGVGIQIDGTVNVDFNLPTVNVGSFSGGIRDTGVVVHAGFYVDLYFDWSTPVGTAGTYFDAYASATAFVHGKYERTYDLIPNKELLHFPVPGATWSCFIVSVGLDFSLDFKMGVKLYGEFDVSATVAVTQPRILKEVTFRGGDVRTSKDVNPSPVVSTALNAQLDAGVTVTPNIMPKLGLAVNALGDRVMYTGVGLNNEFPIQLASTVSTAGSECSIEASIKYDLSLFFFFNNDKSDPVVIIDDLPIMNRCLYPGLPASGSSNSKPSLIPDFSVFKTKEELCAKIMNVTDFFPTLNWGTIRDYPNLVTAWLDNDCDFRICVYWKSLGIDGTGSSYESIAWRSSQLNCDVNSNPDNWTPPPTVIPTTGLGGIIKAAVGGGYLYVLNNGGNLHKCVLPCTGSFSPVIASNGLDIAANDYNIYLINGNRVLYSNTHDGTYNTWKAVPGGGAGDLDNVSAHNNYLFVRVTNIGVNANRVFACSLPCDGSSGHQFWALTGDTKSIGSTPTDLTFVNVVGTPGINAGVLIRNTLPYNFFAGSTNKFFGVNRDFYIVGSNRPVGGSSMWPMISKQGNRYLNLAIRNDNEIYGVSLGGNVHLIHPR